MTYDDITHWLDESEYQPEDYDDIRDYIDAVRSDFTRQKHEFPTGYIDTLREFWEEEHGYEEENDIAVSEAKEEADQVWAQHKREKEAIAQAISNEIPPVKEQKRIVKVSTPSTIKVSKEGDTIIIREGDRVKTLTIPRDGFFVKPAHEPSIAEKFKEARAKAKRKGRRHN